MHVLALNLQAPYQRDYVVTEFLAGPQNTHMGTTLGLRYIRFTYMDALGKSPQAPQVTKP